ncbi:UvrD-helicase domain-containing protein [Bacillus sp. FJAT-52991]|uniref:UvrD-helicase domain-containing protein n=1 Tax=Bacillus kandeliae TaxID=3129297 RepID=A0ABZ2N724_9BACI
MIKRIEEMLLPRGINFTDSQQHVLDMDESINVIAAPGAGKTTVLIAKCALLLKEAKFNSTGVCILTHTNVAVDEIKLGIERLGLGEIQYPNFIGTIQSFFNHFFARKMYQSEYSNNKFRILDEKEYEDYFHRIFERNKPHWYKDDWSLPKPDNDEKYTRDLICDSEGISNRVRHSNDDCELSLQITHDSLLGNGIFCNKDTLLLSKLYIEKYKNELNKVIGKRFKYLLLDEAQDTNELQYQLLSNLLENSGVVFQHFGDPHQQIMNSIGAILDSGWKPHDGKFRKLEIAESNRFGENVAKVLRTTCAYHYSTLQGNEGVNSFQPHVLLYV